MSRLDPRTADRLLKDVALSAKRKALRHGRMGAARRMCLTEMRSKALGYGANLIVEELCLCYVYLRDRRRDKGALVKAAAGVVHGLARLRGVLLSIMSRFWSGDAGQAGLGDRRGRGCRRPRGALRLLILCGDGVAGDGVGVEQARRARARRAANGVARLEVPARVPLRNVLLLRC